MQTIRLIGRSSRLSLLQIDIVKQKIQSAFPELRVEIITRSSKGDALQNVPLHTVEGSDFFTHDIFDALANGEADIAVHSLKDMSSEHFFCANKFAVVDRDDTRDVAIFNANIEEKIRKGETIIIGTCSPRREEMAMVFLKKALPQLHTEIKIETKPIRGNVETRLRKLGNGEYDATILATAGLNRLLRPIPNPSQREGLSASSEVTELLVGKKLMLLPLIECVPAPCQGAIVAEAHFSNGKAIEILEKINDAKLFADCYAEKKEAIKHGVGCLQQFGVTTLQTKHENYLYAAGRDAEGTVFEKWHPLPDSNLNNGNFFSSTDVMKDFFEYEWNNDKITIHRPVVFVANFKAMQMPLLNPPQEGGLCEAVAQSEFLQLNGASQHQLNQGTGAGQKIILASGSRTWFQLAKQGYWVTASADALGFEFLLQSLSMPLFNITESDITILTHETAAARWKLKGYDAVSNARLVSKESNAIQQSVAVADAIFWSSYSQYEFYGQYVKPEAKHVCSGGETAALLKQAGVEPIIFPTIKSFQQWRNSSTRSHSVV